MADPRVKVSRTSEVEARLRELYGRRKGDPLLATWCLLATLGPDAARRGLTERAYRRHLALLEQAGVSWEDTDLVLLGGRTGGSPRRGAGRRSPVLVSDEEGRAYAGGRREDLGGLYVRSSWEANYCRYLNWLVSLGEIAAWEYEPDTFEFPGIKRGNRFYTPDFKVMGNGGVEYHEVKGHMDADSRVKLERMARYYPHVKVVLIDKEAYAAIRRDARYLVPNWE